MGFFEPHPYQWEPVPVREHKARIRALSPVKSLCVEVRSGGYLLRQAA
jgi:hypothetical protein